MASQRSRTLLDVVFAAHFNGPPLTVLDAASWVETFKGDDLELQQHPALQPAILPPAGQPRSLILNIPPPSQVPRLFLRSDRVNEYLVFQYDRIAFGWHRIEPIGEDAAYIGYEELRGHWRTQLDNFNLWCEKRFGARHLVRLVELSYQNALPLKEGEGRPARVPQYFKQAGLGERDVSLFQLAWREALPETENGYVEATATVGTVPPARPAFLFNFAGFAPAALEASIDAVIGVADQLHSHITDMHAVAIDQEAL